MAFTSQPLSKQRIKYSKIELDLISEFFKFMSGLIKKNV